MKATTSTTGPANLHESDQERSNREWAENWNAVTGEPDLNACSTRALLRARNFGSNRIMREHHRAQRDQHWNESLVDSIRTELHGIDQVLRARGEIGAPTVPSILLQALAAPALRIAVSAASAAVSTPGPTKPEESAAIYATAKESIGEDKSPADPQKPTSAEFEAHLTRLHALSAAKVDALGPVGYIAIGKSATSEQWKMVLADVGGGGRWRTQSFDKDGFSGHEIYKNKAEAIAEVAQRHYLRDDLALDRLQDTRDFQRGIFAADLIRQVNSGALTHAGMQQRLDDYFRAEATAGDSARQPKADPTSIHPHSQDTLISQAFEITEDDINTVLRANWSDVVNTDGRPFDDMADDILGRLDHGEVEKAALRGHDLDTQTDYAHEDIARQMRELGVLEIAHEDHADATAASDSPRENPRG